jgi:hypothetical protein
VAASFKRTVRETLRRMVDSGRLDTVPNHSNLFRLGGVVRQLSQEAGVQWQRSKPGSTPLDSRVSPLCHACRLGSKLSCG